MFLHIYNELSFTMTVESTSPLIVRESRYTDEDKKDWSGNVPAVKDRMPNTIPISRSSRDQIRKAVLASRPADPLDEVAKLDFFLPAASMRGSWRSHLERVLRGIDPPESPKVCDPFEEIGANPSLSCSQLLADLGKDGLDRPDESMPHPYRVSCPVCRLFGSTFQASRISISDGIRERDSGRLVQREHVRIDRRTGRVATQSAPLKFFGLQGARFKVNVSIRNFELRHVFLLGILLTELRNGAIPLGAGKNKGYGRIVASVSSIQLFYSGAAAPDRKLRGVAEHPTSAEWFRKRYGITSIEPSKIPTLPDIPWIGPDHALRYRGDLSFNQFDEIWKKIPLDWAAVPYLSARLAKHGG